MPDQRREEIDVPTQAELDKLAEVTAADVERAAVRWRKNAPPAFRELLDAELADDAGSGKGAE